MNKAIAGLLAGALAATGCRKVASQAAPDAGLLSSAVTAAVVDAGAAEGRWSCATTDAESRTLPREAAVGAVLFGGDREPAPLVAYVAEVDGVRRHAAVRVQSSAEALRGPAALGDVPPWTPFVGAAGEGFVRLVTGAKASWVLHAGEGPVIDAPIVLGDELAADALAIGEATVVLAVSVAEGVDVRVVEGSRVVRSFRVDGGEAPAILRGEGSSFAVAARVEATLEPAKPVRDVPTAALEGAGQERTTASLVVVDGGGTRIATHALAATEEVLALTPSRTGLVLASRRVLKGQSLVDLVRVGADGRRVRVGEFPRRRGRRLVPIEAVRDGAVTEVLEVSSEGVTVLGARPGALDLGDVDAVLAVRAVGDRLELVLLREAAETPRVLRAACHWENL